MLNCQKNKEKKEERGKSEAEKKKRWGSGDQTGREGGSETDLILAYKKGQNPKSKKVYP